MSTPRRYAADTDVPVEKTRLEIQFILSRYGASAFGFMEMAGRVSIVFSMNKRNIRFDLPIPSRSERSFQKTMNGKDISEKLWMQACRSRWRALLLCIKSKLEASASGITDFDSEFLAHIVTDNGLTVGARMIPQLTAGGPLLLTGGVP